MRHRWKIVALLSLCGLALFIAEINDFLAINRPVDARVLVVEGWIWQSSAMKEAAEEFKQRQYAWLVTVGEPLEIDGMGTAQKSSADLAAGRLRELGVDATRLVALLVPSVNRHQTYASALTVRNWLTRSRIDATGVNVFTLGTHARKSLVLFQRALGPGIKVGVVAGTEDTYDPRRWWLSTRGIYVVARKALGYVYAVVWPFPSEGPI